MTHSLRARTAPAAAPPTQRPGCSRRSRPAPTGEVALRGRQPRSTADGRDERWHQGAGRDDHRVEGHRRRSGFTTHHPCWRSPGSRTSTASPTSSAGTSSRRARRSRSTTSSGRARRRRASSTRRCIDNGEHVTTVGGGVSQFATTMFNAAFFAGPRHRGRTRRTSSYIGRYPYGPRGDARLTRTPTCRSRTTTPYGILIWPSTRDRAHGHPVLDASTARRADRPDERRRSPACAPGHDDHAPVTYADGHTSRRLPQRVYGPSAPECDCGVAVGSGLDAIGNGLRSLIASEQCGAQVGASRSARAHQRGPRSTEVADGDDDALRAPDERRRRAHVDHREGPAAAVDDHRRCALFDQAPDRDRLVEADRPATPARAPAAPAGACRTRCRSPRPAGRSTPTSTSTTTCAGVRAAGDGDAARRARPRRADRHAGLRPRPAAVGVRPSSRASGRPRRASS